MSSSYPKTPKLSRKFMSVVFDDISTADQIYIVPGFRGKIKKMWSALNDAISGADCDITLKIGGVAVTGGLLTIAQSGSASGDVDSATPTKLNGFTEGQAIEVETDGASTGAVRAVITLELEAT